MRPKNVLCAALGFLLILIAAYFGASIHNSKTNELISHLNEMDQIHYYSPALIPKLNFQAALFTLPLIITLVIVEAIIAFKAAIRQVKNIAIGLLLAAVLLLVLAVIALSNPAQFDFSQWGYVWIAMGAFIVVGNVLSIFIKGQKTTA